jgi:hypothetical protein
MNQSNVLYIVNKFEEVLIADEMDYPEAFAAALYIATVSANQLGMSKDMFLRNCETMYNHDKREQLKEMQ